MSLFAPSEKEIYDWRSGQTYKVNTGLVCVAKAGGNSEVTMLDVADENVIRTEEIKVNSWSAIACSNTNIVYANSKDARVYVKALGTVRTTVLGRHLSTVTSIQVTRDGVMAVSGSYDKTIRVWDLVHLCQKFAFPVEQRVWAVACHPKSSLVAAGTDTSIHIWKTSSGRKLTTLYPPENDTIMSLVFDPSNPDSQIFAGGYDSKVRLWNYTNNQCLNTFSGHTGLIFNIEVTEHVLLTCSRDMKTRIYDRHTGDLLKELGGHTMDVKCCTIIENPLVVITGGFDRKVNVWRFTERDENLEDANDMNCTLQ